MTMMELSFSIILLSLAAWFVFDKIRAEEHQSSIVAMLTNTDDIVNVGIYDEQNGYLSGKNVYCSHTMDYRDISARRIEACTGNDAFKAFGAGNWNIGTNWYFKVGNIEGGTCRLYIDDLDSDGYAVSLFFDCSSAKLNTVKSQYLEEFINGYYQKKYSDKYVGSSYTANCAAQGGCGNTGTISDRKIKIILRN